jgi:predicted 3-demethylubiquinone-9 3-methyltransferase (glyoxalase superfamily)
MQKITPCLWFDNQGEEAANFYVSVFKNSKLGRVMYYGSEGSEITGKTEGEVLTVEFQLEGQDFIALNGGPAFTFNEAISLMVSCETQEEIDELWGKLSVHPESEQCGWLKDKYGVSWQIVPPQLDDMLADPDRDKAARVMRAMLQMKKINLAELQKAYNGN